MLPGARRRPNLWHLQSAPMSTGTWAQLSGSRSPGGEVVHDPLGLRGGSEDGFFVLLQDLQPARQIGGVVFYDFTD